MLMDKIDDDICRKAYDALCRKIGCEEIVVDQNYIDYRGCRNLFACVRNTFTISGNSSRKNSFFKFWINDSYQSFVLDRHDVSKNAIVIAIFNCLMMNSLRVCNIKLDKGFTIEQLLIEDDLRR